MGIKKSYQKPKKSNPALEEMRIKSIITQITSARIHSMNMQELMQTKVFREPIPKRGMNSTV